LELPLIKENWQSKVFEVTLGATSENNGTRGKTITIGGASTLPYFFSEGEIPHRPQLAMEVWDMVPDNWPEKLLEPFSDVINDPGAWAQKCIEEYGADLIQLKLVSAHPEQKNASPEEMEEVVKKVLQAVDVPLIITGPGNEKKDNEIMPAVAEVSRGENCLLGLALEENYRTLAGSCIANGHTIISTSPIDINLAKQLNILLGEMNVPRDKIVIDPTTGALGYGLEYTYSIMERIRLAALQGDKTVAMPFLNFVGEEAWRTKESRESAMEGGNIKLGLSWEILTAITFLHAGSDLLVLRHPESVKRVKEHIDNMMKGKKI